ncbi:MAG: S8 family serine peptidase [Candidatus Sericytochromatia bacterium]|nr:S8 family serine peptidase [Candidatus Sericytochromatia bacterium]
MPNASLSSHPLDFGILGKRPERAKPDLYPVLDCVQPNRLGTYTAYFSFENSTSKEMRLPVGEKNQFTPALSADQNRPHHREREPHDDFRYGDFKTHSTKQSHSQDKRDADLHNPREEREHRDKDPHARDSKDHGKPSKRSEHDRGQPVIFPVGRSAIYPNSPVAVVFNTDHLTWKLGNHFATAQANHLTQRCQREAIAIPADAAVRKTFLPTTTLTFNAAQMAQTLNFQVDESADLRRRILLTARTGQSGVTVNGLEVLLNGQNVLAGVRDQRILTPNTPDLTLEVAGLLRQGANTLEIIAQGSSGSQAQVRLDGFMLPLDIPTAFHSAIAHSPEARRSSVEAGVVGVKFLEGSKIRLAGDSLQGLHDESELSLRMLQAALGSRITGVYPTMPGTPAEHEQSEQYLQTTQGREVPNQSLFYRMTFAPNQDVWEVVDRLKVLPFVEEAFPVFIPASPYQPKEMDPALNGEYKDPQKRLWLENTRILSHTSASSSIQPGAWDITRGSPQIKIAVLEHGFNRNHPDLQNIEYEQNVELDPGYKDFRHGTQTLGVVGATADSPNGEGVAGVAHGSKTIHIHFFNNDAPGNPSLCKGGTQPYPRCDKIIDSLELALKKGARVILLEITGEDKDNPGTIEHVSPETRVRINHLSWDLTVKNTYGFNPVIVIPSGNRACEAYKDIEPEKTFKKACYLKFPKGKDVREGFFDEVVYRTVWAVDQFGTRYPEYYYKEKITRNGPMMDTGSIIVGGLNIAGTSRTPSQKIIDGILEPGFHYGKQGNFITDGHGIDVSAPAEKIWTTAESGGYANYGGSSGAAPVVAGVAALMLSQDPTLTPLWVRHVLSQTAQDSKLIAGEDMPGLVNAYEAVKQVSPPLPSPSPSGGFSKLSVSESAPTNGPGNVSVWITREGRGIQVNSSQLLGIGITNQDLTGLQISIDNNPMPIRSFAQNYVTFGIPANLSPGVKNVLLTLAGNSISLEEAIEVLALPPLQEVQSLTTHAALGSASFAIDNQRYLAFANYYNGTSHSITSDIYRWQNSQFMPFQALPSLGAYDVEPFQIGNDSYLALINNYDGASGNHLLDSQIYKWNGTQFERFQNFSTEGATDAEHFVINGEHYLAVTHFWNRGPDLTSVIYKWNGSQFVQYQSIPTTGGFRWKAFQIGNESFLALASYAAYYGGNANTTSHIFKWNGAHFVNFQAIPTVNAYDWEAFSIDNQHYLAVANFGANIANQTGTSVIYRWSGTQFEPFQNITTSKATDWEYFEVNGVSHLIVASYEQASRIYRWEGSDFQLYRTLLSDGNIHWEFMTVGAQEYLLAVSNYYGSEGYNTPSKVYKFE